MTAPEEISFYLPNNNGGGADPVPFIAGRRTWVALFGSDRLVYASDMAMGFFVLRLNQRTVVPAASMARRQHDGPADVHVVSGTRSHRLEFTTSRSGVSLLSVYDISGRRVAEIRDPVTDAGAHALEWNLETSTGHHAASGVYLARLMTPDGPYTRKLLQLGSR